MQYPLVILKYQDVEFQFDNLNQYLNHKVFFRLMWIIIEIAAV